MGKYQAWIVVGVGVASIGAGALWAGLSSNAQPLVVGGGTAVALGMSVALWNVHMAHRVQRLSESLGWKQQDQAFRREMGPIWTRFEGELETSRNNKQLPQGPSLHEMVGKASWPDEPWPNPPLSAFARFLFRSYPNNPPHSMAAIIRVKEIVEQWGFFLQKSGSEAAPLRLVLEDLARDNGDSLKLLWYLIEARSKATPQMPLPPQYNDFESVRAAFYPNRTFLPRRTIAAMLGKAGE